MTIGVWVGRPDGAPVPGLLGRATAAPILFDAFARAGFAPAPLPHAPKGAVFAASNKLPPPLQRFSAGGPGEAVEPPRIMFPPDGAQLELASGSQPDPVALKIAGGRAPLTVMVNGVPLGHAERPAHRVLPARWPRLCAADGDGCARRHRQRHGAVAIERRMTGPWLGPIVRAKVADSGHQTREHDHQSGTDVALLRRADWPRRSTMPSARTGARRLLLVAFSLLAFLPGFFQIPPVDRDEARFAQATKQMLETREYVDIRFQDEVRYKKPVGIYWLQAPP